MLSNLPHLHSSLGVLDSGIGGLSLVAQLAKDCPNLKIAYQCDSANVPYGSKDPDFIQEKLFKMVEQFVGLGISTQVIACNTLTMDFISECRKRYPQVNFIGMEPYFNSVTHFQLSRQAHKVALLLTPNSFQAKRVKELQQKFDAEKIIEVFPMPQLASAIENYAINPTPQMATDIERQLLFLVEKGFNVCVLGCTHYCWIREAIEGLGIKTIDTNLAVSKRILDIYQHKQKDSNWLALSFNSGECWEQHPTQALERIKQRFQQLTFENV